MENVIVAYCNSNEKDFERTIPLQFVGQRNQKLGLSNDINIVFSYGYNALSSAYRTSLKNLGFRLHDASSLYQEVEHVFPRLHTFSNYAKNTYLQWPLIKRFFDGQPIIHYDGDIVFNEDPKIIAQKVAGKTFILQGCPAFAVITQYTWFDSYAEHLNAFLNDTTNYCSKAWEERNGWEITFKTRWAGSRFNKIFLHDQDLLSHLIHTGKIVQDSVEDISRCLHDYVSFENPLFIHFYDDNYPYTYSREHGIDYFSSIRRDGQDVFYKKKVLFWHMQNCFNFYASKFVLRKKFFPFIPLGRIKMNLCAKGFEDFFNKLIRPYTGHTDRLSVYRYYFQDSDFSNLLTDKRWWKRGVFL